MLPLLIASATVLLVAILWWVDINPKWLGTIGVIGMAATWWLSRRQGEVSGGGWWCFAPMKAVGSRCIEADGVGTGDRNVCETSCSVGPERQPTIDNIRKFITSTGMKFPINDTFLDRVSKPGDYRKNYRKFVATKYYQNMVFINNDSNLYNAVMERLLKDSGVKFIGSLPIVCLEKDSTYYNNTKNAIKILEEKGSGIFSNWFANTDKIVIDILKGAIEETDQGTNEINGCMALFSMSSVYLNYMHLITGDDPTNYSKLHEWIINGFTGRTGVEVFFARRLGYSPHRQVMIVDHNAKTIFYFEPNVGIGETTMKSMFRIIFNGSGYKIVDLEWDNCPYAFQAVDRTDGIEDNYCQTWSMFIGAIFALNHPKFTKEQIFGWLVSLGEKALDILILFMFRLYMTDSGFFLRGILANSIRDNTVSHTHDMYMDVHKLDTFTDPATGQRRGPRRVRTDIKSCRNILRALVESAYEAFGDLPEGGIRVDQIHYSDMIRDIKKTANSLTTKYEAMINDRDVPCDKGSFAREVSDLISQLDTKYMNTGKFGKLLATKLSETQI